MKTVGLTFSPSKSAKKGSKAALIEQAKSLGIEVPQGAKIEELKALIEKVNKR